jgi:hypothetical protein
MTATISIVQRGKSSSGNVMTVGICLSDAVAILSYQVELAVSGAAGGARCSHQSAEVAGMAVDASAGASAVAGYSPDGVTFGPAGLCIGTATITLDQAPTDDFRVELRSAELLNTAFEIVPWRTLSVTVAAANSSKPAAGAPSGATASGGGAGPEAARHAGGGDGRAVEMVPAMVSGPRGVGLVGLCQRVAGAVAGRWWPASDSRSRQT